MTPDGEQLGWVRIDNDPVALGLELAKAGPDPEVVLEATYGWYWAVDVLQAAGATVHISILLLENVLTPSPTRHHELAVRAIRRGPYAWLFWFGAIGLGGAVPIALVWMMLAPAIALSSTFVVPAAAFALAGGFAWEYIWVDAGQAVPNS